MLAIVLTIAVAALAYLLVATITHSVILSLVVAILAGVLTFTATTRGTYPRR